MTSRKLQLPFFAPHPRKRTKKQEDQIVRRMSATIHDLDKDLADLEPDDLVWENEFDPGSKPGRKTR